MTIINNDMLYISSDLSHKNLQELNCFSRGIMNMIPQKAGKNDLNVSLIDIFSINASMIIIDIIIKI